MSDDIDCSAMTLHGQDPPCERTLNTRQGQDAAAELPMDQGMRACLQVLGSWILFANTWYLSSILLFDFMACVLLKGHA